MEAVERGEPNSPMLHSDKTSWLAVIALVADPKEEDLMKGRLALAGVAVGQLAAGLIGLRIALRKRLPSDPVGIHLNLSTDHLARNQIVLGTAKSAPGVMLAIQAMATAALLRAPSRRARRTLGVLGCIMTFGYLVERHPPVGPGRFDPVETPVYGVGLLSAVLMAWLGLRRYDS